MYLAVRLRGHAGVNSDIEETMEFLGLKAPNNCVVIPENPVNKGMLQKAKDYIAWGEIDKKTAELLKSENKIEGKDEKFIIRFSPPSKGFKDLKLHYPKGDLGYRGKEIGEFVKKYR